MSGGSQQTSSQSTSSAPWQPAQGHLKGILGDARQLYKQDAGFEAYGSAGSGKKPWTEFSGQTNDALRQMQGLASQPNQFYQGSADYTKSLIGGGQALDQSGYQNLMGQNPNAIAKYGTGIASGQQGITVNPQLQKLVGQNANAVDQYGRPIASGQNRINTEGDYRGLMGSIDPEFEKVVGQTANDLGDQIQRQFGGASYGAPENAKYLSEGVGNVVSRMRSDNFNQNLASKTGLLNNITGLQGQNIGNQLSASGLLSGEQLGNRGQQAGILGQIGGFENQNINNRLNAAGMLSGEQQTGFNNSRGLLQDMSGLQQQDIQNRLAGVDRADSVYNSQYLPAQQMAGVGAAYDQKNQDILNAKMDRYNTNQMSDWDRLAQYFGVASGTGQQGNRATTTTSEPTDIFSKLLGGGLLGSQLIPGMR
jgi:hypothetical protein